jgi:Flp pilus assembly protein TadB
MKDYENWPDPNASAWVAAIAFFIIAAILLWFICRLVFIAIVCLVIAFLAFLLTVFVIKRRQNRRKTK